MAAKDNLNIWTRSSIGHTFNIIIIIIFLIPITPETITWASFTAKAITNDIQNGRGGHIGLDFEVENDMNHCTNMVYKLLDQNNKKKIKLTRTEDRTPYFVFKMAAGAIYMVKYRSNHKNNMIFEFLAPNYPLNHILSNTLGLTCE